MSVEPPVCFIYKQIGQHKGVFYTKICQNQMRYITQSIHSSTFTHTHNSFNSVGNTSVFMGIFDHFSRSAFVKSDTSVGS